VKLLWDLMDVIGHRFVIIAENKTKGKVDYNYPDKSEKLNNLLIFNCASENNFTLLIAILSEHCITEFFITINSLFDNIIKAIKENGLNKEFNSEKYMSLFPRTIHVKEDEFFVDFSTFKEHVYQLKRAASRYLK